VRANSKSLYLHERAKTRIATCSVESLGQCNKIRTISSNAHERAANWSFVNNNCLSSVRERNRIKDVWWITKRARARSRSLLFSAERELHLSLIGATWYYRELTARFAETLSNRLGHRRNKSTRELVIVVTLEDE